MIIAPIVALFEKVCSRWKPLISLYSFPYKNVIAREIKIAKICADDKVLNIGCGAVPFTAIMIAQSTQAHVVAIDNDLRAVERAADCVKKMQLDHLISVKHFDGKNIDVKDFSAVLLALQTRPKNEIICRILKESNSETRIIVRRPRAGLDSEYDPLPSDLSYCCKVLHPHMHTFDASVIYSSSLENHCHNKPFANRLVTE